MAITYLGAKRLQGLKTDRKSDSLGSSGIGTNTGVTINNVKDYAVFDGSNDYITFATKFDNMQQAGSFSVWIKPANIGSTGNDIIFDNSDVSSANNGFSIRHSDPSGSKTVVLYGIWGSTDGSITTDAIWTGDEWQHLCTTYDGTTAKIYRNGTLVKSGALTANSSAGSYNARIGWGADGNDHKFEGGMYQALIYNDALTQSEVTTLYNSGTPVASPSTSGLVTKLNLSSDTNDSQGSNNGTNTGVTFSTDNTKFGGAYSFNGSSSVVEVSGQTTFTEINNPNQISTIVFWYNSSSSPSSTYDKIMGTVDQSASDRGFNIMRTGSSGSGMVSLTQAGGNKAVNDLETYTNLFPVDGNWHHYAFKFDDVAGKISIYKDGLLFQEENYASWTPATDGNTQRPFRFGRDESNTKWFNGKIDDCAIYYRGLTATEIETLVNTTVTQGYRGGIGYNASTYTGGGGGGSGSAGNDGVSGTGGNGGNGLASSITGSSLTYGAGGGGGGTGATNGSAGSNTASNYGKGGTGSGSAGNAGVVIVAYTTASGISATGGSIDTSGRSGYKVHTFTSSGTFQITSGSGDVEYLVLGGGAGSGVDNYSGARGFGGGGGGGILTGTKSSMSSGSYTVTIGSAGSAGSGNTNAGNGGNSVFDNLTAYGGGFGSSHYSSTSGGQWGGIGNGGTGGGSNNSPSLRGYAIHNTNTGALVSSLTNKSGLKAHYTMDSKSIPSLYSTDFTSDSDNALWSEQDTSAIGISDSNDRIDFEIRRNASNDSMSYDLGKTLDSEKWTMRCKLKFTDFVTPAGGGSVGFIGLGDKDSSSSSAVTQDFIGLMPRFSNSEGEWFASAFSDSRLTEQDSAEGAAVRTQIGGNDELGSNGNHNTDDWGIQIKRTSATKCKISLWKNHTFTGSVWNEEELTITTAYSGFRYIVFKNTVPTSSSINSHLDGYITDIEIWDGSEAEGCNNDASTTANLDSYTNLPVNTIFEQTDTPMYYWKQSDNTWKLDGTTHYINNFDSDTGTVLYESNQTIGWDSSGKYIKQYRDVSSSTNSGSAWYMDLGELGDKFIMRFRNYADGSFSETVNSNHRILVQNKKPTTNGNEANCMAIGYRWYYGTQQWSSEYLKGIEPRVVDGGSHNGLHSNNQSHQRLGNGGKGDRSPDTSGQATYMEFKWDKSSGEFTFTSYTDATYTTVQSTAMVSDSGSYTHWNSGTPENITGLRYLLFTTNNDSWHGTGTIILDNLEIQKGVSTWIE